MGSRRDKNASSGAHGSRVTGKGIESQSLDKLILGRGGEMNTERGALEQLRSMIDECKRGVVFTGAGISTESGIPDFRSAGGLWSKYDPSEYATITAFRSNPVKVWEMLREMDDLISNAKPNKAHLGMGELEQMGFLHHMGQIMADP